MICLQIPSHGFKANYNILNEEDQVRQVASTAINPYCWSNLLLSHVNVAMNAFV